jgi:hypothetical protein
MVDVKVVLKHDAARVSLLEEKVRGEKQTRPHHGRNRQDHITRETDKTTSPITN